MEIETAELIGKILGNIGNIERIVWLAADLIWVTIYYILYQMFRLKFLKFMIASEAMAIVYWFWSHLYYFTGVPEQQNNSIGHTTLVWGADVILRCIPLILITIGGILGLKYLQTKWKEKEPSQQEEPS